MIYKIKEIIILKGVLIRVNSTTNLTFEADTNFVFDLLDWCPASIPSSKIC